MPKPMEPVQVFSLWTAHLLAITALILVLVWALANQVDYDTVPHSSHVVLRRTSSVSNFNPPFPVVPGPTTLVDVNCSWVTRALRLEIYGC